MKVAFCTWLVSRRDGKLMKLLLIYEILKNIYKDCIKYNNISSAFQAQREQFPQTAWICYAEIYMTRWRNGKLSGLLTVTSSRDLPGLRPAQGFCDGVMGTNICIFLAKNLLMNPNLCYCILCLYLEAWHIGLLYFYLISKFQGLNWIIISIIINYDERLEAWGTARFIQAKAREIRQVFCCQNISYA